VTHLLACGRGDRVPAAHLGERFVLAPAVRLLRRLAYAGLMIPVLSRAEMRRFDAHASSACQVPSLLLMENAGRGAADVIARELGLPQRSAARIVIVCGAGNNGGDGFVVARRLLTLGAEPRVYLLVKPERLTGDALSNYRSLLGVGGVVVELEPNQLNVLGSAIESAHAVVDAVFGTGLDREVSGFFRYAIEFMNGARCPIFALDLPSGLDADTGAVLGAAVRAGTTITFAHAKLGLMTASGLQHSGKLHTVDIGVPDTSLAQIGYSAEIVEGSDVLSALVARSVTTHKGSAGRVVVIAGSPGKIGAALLAAQGALRAGAGLVTIAALPETAALLDQRVLEVMTARIEPERIEDSLDELLERADAVAIGPGLGLSATARRIVEHVALRVRKTKVLDADAITHFAGRAEELRGAAGELVLTPHAGEMARMVGGTAADVEADRFGTLTRAVALTGSVVLLKGHNTLVGAPEERVAVNVSGSGVLATGGSGDVLTGILAAFGALLDIRRAAYAAAYVHGIAGQRRARQGVDRGVLAHEIADEVPLALGALRAGD
jgi:ADP-dependent NAD(P)H-hydrate dehydratase / NAD(P)H-hydrate epimerase